MDNPDPMKFLTQSSQGGILNRRSQSGVISLNNTYHSTYKGVILGEMAKKQDKGKSFNSLVTIVFEPVFVHLD